MESNGNSSKLQPCQYYGVNESLAFQQNEKLDGIYKKYFACFYQQIQEEALDNKAPVRPFAPISKTI